MGPSSLSSHEERRIGADLAILAATVCGTTRLSRPILPKRLHLV